MFEVLNRILVVIDQHEPARHWRGTNLASLENHGFDGVCRAQFSWRILDSRRAPILRETALKLPPRTQSRSHCLVAQRGDIKTTPRDAQTVAAPGQACLAG